MIEHRLRQRRNRFEFQKKRDMTPPKALEYAYYVSLCYTHMAPMVGLSVPLLGVVMLASVAGLCLHHF